MSGNGVFQGTVRHRRFTPVHREFSYQFSMFGFDLDDIDQLTHQYCIFGRRWYHPICFCEKDYLKSEPGELKERIALKVKGLGGEWQGSKVIMLIQCRSLGLYFSPINFYYCFDDDKKCRLMLAEVCNTPWQERHYYLVNIEGDDETQKEFHVSPFMALDMNYRWKVKPIDQKAFVHLENHTKGTEPEKVFDATMALTKQPMTTLSMIKTWCSLPFSAIKVVVLIYWQALKIFLRGVPFIPYPKQ